MLTFLILINIEQFYSQKLFDLLSQRMPLGQFLGVDGAHGELLDPRISTLINLIHEMDSGFEDIWVESPFIWEPHIKLILDKLPHMHGKPVIPVGDAFFYGHVKVGNGLGHHLTYVSRLAECISSSVSRN